MIETLTAWAPRVLSVLRIYAGLLLFAHGTAKILGFPVVANFANIQTGSLTWTSGMIELIGACSLPSACVRGRPPSCSRASRPSHISW